MKFSLKKSGILLSALIIFNQLSISAQNDELDPELQKNFIIIENSHNFNLDPHTANYSAEAQILTGLYEGLFSYDPITLEPVYALADSYKLSRDKKRWTFILKDNIKFSDGVKITSEDVKKAWLSMISNPYAPYASLFDIVKGAQDYRTGSGKIEDVGIYTQDEKTISIHLSAPAAHLPKLLCMPAFSVRAEDAALFTGPFCLAEYTPLYMTLKKNENYWDAEHTKLEQITILLSNEAEDNSFAFNTGNADWIASSFDEKMLLSKDAVHVCAEFATQYFFFKFTENSPFNNLSLRRALLEAAPWEALRENSYVPAQTLVYSLSGYPNVEGYVYTDTTEAEILIKQAKEELSLSDQDKITIKFAIPDSEYMNKKAELLKDAWSPLGINLEIITFPEFEYLNKIESTEADLFTYTWIGDFADPLAFLELFRSNSTMNVTNWKNEEFDSLLEKAALYTDENHNKLLSQAEQILIDNAVILPVQHPVSVNIIDLNAVGGWAINAFDIHPLKYLFKRKTEAKIPNIVMARE